MVKEKGNGFGMPKLQSRALKYGYSNARVKAMKGLLLKQSMLEELIKVGSIEAMIEILQRTTYRNDLQEAALYYRGSDMIEMAASLNFGRMVRKLLRVSPKDDRPIIEALLVKWDLLNLKTMMHAKMLGRGYDDIKHLLFCVGGLSVEDFKRIMKADEREILRVLRRTKLGEQMLSSSTEHFSHAMWETFRKAMRNLDTFTQTETIIDAYSFMLMDKALCEGGGKVSASIRDLLRREIDARNVMIIERLKRHSTEKAKIRKSLIKGGTFSENLLDRLMDAKDVQTVANMVRPKFRQLEVADSDPKLTDLEIALEKSLAAQRLLTFHRSTLSVGVIIGFLLLKEEEMSNLRKIAKCKEFKVPEAEVRKMLVVV